MPQCRLRVRAAAPWLLLATAVGLLLLYGKGRPARAFVDRQLPTLSVVCKEAHAIAVLKVEKINREKKAIVYSKVRYLKGTILGRNQEPHGASFTHILREANTIAIRPTMDAAGQDRLNDVILDLATEGKTAVIFQCGDLQLVCVGQAWYSLCLNPVGKGSLPQAVASDARYSPR